jgi:hypothetical protein
MISANGTWYGMNEDAMLNLIGLLSRTLPFINDKAIRMIGWAGYLIAIIFSIVFWAKKNQPYEGLFSISIILALFFAPHLHYHDLTLLAIPLLFVELKYPCLENLLLSTSFILLILKPLFYILPYVLYAILIWYFARVLKPSKVINNNTW